MSRTNLDFLVTVREHLEWQEYLSLPIRLLSTKIDRFHLGKRILGGPHDREMVMWSEPFPGGLSLARYIFANPQEFAGKNVSDFGAGSGVVAIAAKMAGAAHVTAYDSNRSATYAMGLNALENGVNINIVWKNVCEPNLDFSDTDIVTAADLFYVNGDRTNMCELLTRLASEGKTVYATACDEDLTNFFERECGKSGVEFVHANSHFVKMVKSPDMPPRPAQKPRYEQQRPESF